VYGASGHGKVVADILLTRGIAIAGFIDDNSDSREILGLPIVGDHNWLEQQAKSASVAVVLGIGDNISRQAVARSCIACHIELQTAVHPSARVASSARVGAGVVVMAGSVINPDAQIGAGAIINTGAIVEHDCQVGEFAHLSPNSVMGGGAVLGSLSWLGIGATIIHGVRVGSGTIVGAGAAVIRNLPDDVVAVGVPAVVRRKISHGERTGGL
jgi:sugar O-acyltransferase (sialic acid O-acetyltransferase NeuD family)